MEVKATKVTLIIGIFRTSNLRWSGP